MSECASEPAIYTCKKCGWSRGVKAEGRTRCYPCHEKLAAKWRAANREKVLARYRKAAQKRRDEQACVLSEQRRMRRLKDPAPFRKHDAERAAWLRTGDVTRAQLESIYIASDGRCHYCRTPVAARFLARKPRGFDHVVPRTKGGIHTALNLVVCCIKCNIKKGNSLLP